MKNNTQTIAVVGIILIILAAGALFLFRTQSPQNPMTQIPVSTSTPDAASSANVTFSTDAPLSQSTPVTQEAAPGMRLYKNTAFHLSLTYPDTLQATEYQEQGGALTVTFQNTDNSQAFEIYVTPYSGTQITQSRFSDDEPSGTFLEPTNIVVDGTQATMFYGHNAIMGDTREVWFIHGGFLYEVATYKALDTWLAGIMQTWKFV
jgi:hypothetical protein